MVHRPWLRRFGQKLFFARAPRMPHCFTIVRNSGRGTRPIGQSVQLFFRYRASNFVGVAVAKIQHSVYADLLAYGFGHLLVAALQGPLKDGIPVTRRDLCAKRNAWFNDR